MHGDTKLTIMKTNVDDTAFALASNVVALIDFTATNTASGGKIHGGSFLTYTGFTDKLIVMYGTSSGSQNFKLCK